MEKFNELFFCFGLGGRRRCGLSGQFRELSLEFVDAARQPGIFLARLGRHVAGGLEFLALHHIHGVENALGLPLEGGLDIHIVTEGPLGYMARRYCRNAGRPFTTSYHTRFPEYLSARLPVPESWAYRWLRDFHNSGQGTLVATQSLADDLAARGFTKLRPWTRGVDTDHFRPDKKKDLGFPAPVFLCVGRVAIEKNLTAFLDLDLPGSKVIVGEGPEFAKLKAKYPDAHFLGHRPNDELAEIYASADVFVFPSRTDTFGNVIIEALASGTPVAAYPVTGPIDIVGDGIGGAVSDDLRQAALTALNVSRDQARERAMRYSWKACAEMFMDTVEEALGAPRKLAA